MLGTENAIFANTTPLMTGILLFLAKRLAGTVSIPSAFSLKITWKSKPIAVRYYLKTHYITVFGFATFFKRLCQLFSGVQTG